MTNSWKTQNKSLTCTLKYALSSPKKMETIAKFVKGNDVDDAINKLHFTQKKSAKILLKVIKSAYYNAKKLNFNSTDLKVSEIIVWKWPKLKRVRFVWRAKVHGYIKYRTYIKVILDTKNNK